MTFKQLLTSSTRATLGLLGCADGASRGLCGFQVLPLCNKDSPLVLPRLSLRAPNSPPRLLVCCRVPAGLTSSPVHPRVWRLPSWSPAGGSPGTQCRSPMPGQRL